VLKPEKQENPTTFNKIMKAVGYPVAAISGLWATKVSVHNNAYNTAKKLGAFDDILEKTTPESRSQIKDLINNAIPTEEYITKSLQSKAAYQAAADERLELMGLNTFKNKWDYMAKASKQDAVLIGLTVSGIAIGAWLSIANNKSLSNLFSNGKENDTKTL
jgi:hypothetical protein